MPLMYSMVTPWVFRALNLIQRQLVEALGLELADVLGTDVCRASWNCRQSGRSSVYQGLRNLAGVGARGANVNSPAPCPSRNEPSIASEPASRRRSNLTLAAVRPLVVGRKAGQLVDRRLGHIPVAVQLPERFQSPEGGANLEEHLPW